MVERTKIEESISRINEYESEIEFLKFLIRNEKRRIIMMAIDNIKEKLGKWKQKSSRN